MTKDAPLGEDGTFSSTFNEPIVSENHLAPHILIQNILSEVHELKAEVVKLREEIAKNRQMISRLEKNNELFGKEVIERVESMLALIRDYGGSMTSIAIKKIMGLSKDEFYRTLKCAKDRNQIEIVPNPKDLRSYIIKIKFE